MLILAAMVTLAAVSIQTGTDADPDFAIQGEYVGLARDAEGTARIGVQVVALGNGKFSAVLYRGGLPGAGWRGSDRITADGERTGDRTVFRLEHAEGGFVIRDGVMTVMEPGEHVAGTLRKTSRESPTLGMRPPEGAVVLFDGKTADRFHKGRMTEDGLLMEGATSKPKFRDFRLHLEFRTPFMPSARGQARGNSGCYLQGRIEVQILDSFGLEGLDNQCGGVYKVARPLVNMCLPPLSWQTYDIDFTAATYEAGKKVRNARMTVWHNGTMIHHDLEVPRATTAAPLAEGNDPGPVHLQNHGNPVRFRNIWVVEKG